MLNKALITKTVKTMTVCLYYILGVTLRLHNLHLVPCPKLSNFLDPPLYDIAQLLDDCKCAKQNNA